MRVHVSHGCGSDAEMIVAGGGVLVVVVKSVVVAAGTDDVAVAPATVVDPTEVDVVPADPEQPAARTTIAVALAVVLSLFKVGILSLHQPYSRQRQGHLLSSVQPSSRCVSASGRRPT